MLFQNIENNMKYIKRIIGLPFFLILNIVGMFFMLFTLAKYFILYGGEAIAYHKKDSPKKISDVYEIIEKQYLK